MAMTRQAYAYAADNPVNKDDPNGASSVSSKSSNNPIQRCMTTPSCIDDLAKIADIIMWYRHHGDSSGFDGYSLSQFATYLYYVRNNEQASDDASGELGNDMQWQCLTANDSGLVGPGGH
jgi:hypothetical protein